MPVAIETMPTAHAPFLGPRVAAPLADAFHTVAADYPGPLLKDLPDAELHLLDTGHFALEQDGDFIAERIRDFLGRHVTRR